MKLTKAIEIVSDYTQEKAEPDYQDLIDALKILTKAGQFIQTGRDDPFPRWTVLLPGETID